jgi:hypothetical protein
MKDAKDMGTDRIGEVLAEYRRMKGVAGDTLQLGTFDLLSGLLADIFHYAKFAGIDANLAIADGYRMFAEESVI